MAVPGVKHLDCEDSLLVSNMSLVVLIVVF